jgi:hypothetical protein
LGHIRQRFGADGGKFGEEFRVNTTAAGDQHNVTLAALPQGVI